MNSFVSSILTCGRIVVPHAEPLDGLQKSPVSLDEWPKASILAGELEASFRR